VIDSANVAFVVTLLDDISPAGKQLLDILLQAWPKADQWPHRQYVDREMADAGLDLAEVLQELPAWRHGYQAVRVLHRAMEPPQGAPAELGDQIAPTVYGLVHSAGEAAEMVQAFLSAVRVGYAYQSGFLPDPVKIKTVKLTSDDLIHAIRAERRKHFGEFNARLVRQMLAGEPATWLGVNDPDDPVWAWNLLSRSLRRFAVGSGLEYLTALEELIAVPRQPVDSLAPIDPSALPRALDHLDAVWQVVAGQRLFKRPGFAVTASLAEGPVSAAEFEMRCNALYNVFSMLTVPEVDKAEGALNFLRADLARRMTDPASLDRATNAVRTLQQIVKLRRGQAHPEAAQDSRQAAARLGISLTGDWAGSWDQVRRVAVEAIYVLIEELEAITP
jgi:hypothetical protein